jgi:hypothetical protein
LVERANVGESAVLVVGDSNALCDDCWISGWFETRTGKNELIITNEDPRQVTPIITKKDARRKILGTTSINIIDEIAPVNPNPRSNFFRLFPALC